MIRRLILTLVVALGMFSTAEAAWDESRAAFLRGDYETAVREVRPLAEQGDAPAQFFLGDMYAKGRGVPQDDAEAAKWYREAAEHGVADAQYNTTFRPTFG